MIAAHPWTGIGMGNYPVMRNDPVYLGRMMPVRYYDLPGLGLLWVAAELGIPALIALYGMMLYPAFLVYKRKGNGVLLGLALCQPYVHLLGAQITC
jgi:O-antigen ligase